MVRHEKSHLSHQHHRYLLIGHVIDRLFGRITPVGRSVQFLRLEIERWADENVVVEASDPQVVSSAMKAIAGVYSDSTVAAFGPADLTASRIDQLRQPRGAAGLADRTLPCVVVASGVALVAGSILFWLT